MPFLRIVPEADIPVVMLSLRHDLDPARHLAIGGALTPLRDEGVLIVGSSQGYHNLSRFMDCDGRTAEEFDTWLNDAATAADPHVRNSKLKSWMSAPSARAAHPREEQLMSLMVIAGAGRDRTSADAPTTMASAASGSPDTSLVECGPMDTLKTISIWAEA